jgi:hypothetical protein
MRQSIAECPSSAFRELNYSCPVRGPDSNPPPRCQFNSTTPPSSDTPRRYFPPPASILLRIHTHTSPPSPQSPHGHSTPGSIPPPASHFFLIDSTQRLHLPSSLHSLPSSSDMNITVACDEVYQTKVNYGSPSPRPAICHTARSESLK